ncbi:MAG: MarR family winged helix-turn-helix transcriptional regulator [Dehalococcoidales bacterium]
MAEVDIDRILENMFHVMLVSHKKILKMDVSGYAENLTRLHFAVMGEISQNKMTMSELAKALMMTKPQLTHLVDALVALNLVERLPEAKDRRVIYLVLTDKGRLLGMEMKKKVNENIKRRLACLTPEELVQMSAAFETLRKIVGKL